MCFEYVYWRFQFVQTFVGALRVLYTESGEINCGPVVSVWLVTPLQLVLL